MEAERSVPTDIRSDEEAGPYGADDRAKLAHELLLTQMQLDNWLRPWVRRERFGLSPSLTMVLYTIRDEPTPTLRHLAERLDVTPTAITSITDRLESLGFVRRVRTPGDRRRTQLEITPAGREISIEIEASFVRDIQAALAVWDSGRLDLVHQATKTLNGFVSDLNRVTPKSPATDD
ncbi:MAG TPA: MarR family transcriptional regulator [Thermomicrobiales bacterium]|nr:MarR family transcriptional regulator [Thermomicrobiales bacterium]